MQRLGECGERFGCDVNRFVRIVQSNEAMIKEPRDVIVFNVGDRTDNKTGSSLEHKVMRFLLPGAKFLPIELR